MVSREDQVCSEAELAKRLLAASDEERQRLYSEVYDRVYSMYFERDPGVLDFGATEDLMPTLLQQTQPGDQVLEVGCGTGLLAIGLRDAGRRVTAVDVSEVALERAAERASSLERLDLLRVDGVALPFQSSGFDFAYSVEVVEHLHERDAPKHFAEVARVLKPGGNYWFMTPRPHPTVSARDRFGVDFDVDADVHLKEWSHRELQPVLHRAGFRRVAVPLANVGPRARLAMPSVVAGWLESVTGLPTMRVGYILGLNQCIVRATKR